MSYEDSLKRVNAAGLLSWRFAEIGCVADIVRYWATHRPTKTALTEGAASRTYAQLDEASNRIANRLLERGIARGSPIGFVGRNAIETFEVWFGAAKAGCALAAFNWRCSVEELIAILEDSRSPLVFVGTEFLKTMKAVQARCRPSFEIVAFDPCSQADGGLAGWSGNSSAADPKNDFRGRRHRPSLLHFRDDRTAEGRHGVAGSVRLLLSLRRTRTCDGVAGRRRHADVDAELSLGRQLGFDGRAL